MRGYNNYRVLRVVDVLQLFKATVEYDTASDNSEREAEDLIDLLEGR